MNKTDAQRRIVISVDAMGGDNAPASVVEGVSIAISRYSNADFLLYGDKNVLRPLMNQCRIHSNRCQVVHTDEFVKADDKPAMVVRHGRKTSMWLSIAAVRDGEADAVVSAGNTGALMVMAKFCLSMMRGIDRPAICTAIPNKKERVVMLDLGANAECSSNNLVQFAIMGSVYSRTLFGISNPKVGLLNIGSEETKGREEIKEAAGVLRDFKEPPFEFVGFAEGNDIFGGKFDVIATDGFSGNIALKTMEGTAKFLMLSLKEYFKASYLAKLGILFILPALLKFKKRYNPKNYNGAMFMGVKGIAIKSHGGADAKAFANAIGTAYKMASQRVIESLQKEMSKLNPEVEVKPNLTSNVININK